MSWPRYLGSTGGSQIYPHNQQQQQQPAQGLIQMMRMQFQLQQNVPGQNNPYKYNSSRNHGGQFNNRNNADRPMANSKGPAGNKVENLKDSKSQKETAESNKQEKPPIAQAGAVQNQTKPAEIPTPANAAIDAKGKTESKLPNTASGDKNMKADPPLSQQGAQADKLMGGSLMGPRPLLVTPSHFDNSNQKVSPSKPPYKHQQQNPNSAGTTPQGNTYKQNISNASPNSNWQQQQPTKDWQSHPGSRRNVEETNAPMDYNQRGSQANYAQGGSNPRMSGDNRSGRKRPLGSQEMQGRAGPKGNFGYDRFKDRVEQTLSGPMTDLKALDISEKKFNAYSKIFIGNIPKSVNQEELLTLFRPYGEIGPVYINKDSAFGFIYLDYKANAAKAVREVDSKPYQNRYLKVRFATINEGIRVRNLSSYVSNELLEKAFSVFGQIESCRVLVDDRGNPKGEGIVIFKEKKNASLALRKCTEECYFLSGALRPVVVTLLDPTEDNVEGVPESVIPRDEQFRSEREIAPHFADPTTFEFEFGNQWKKLFSMYDEKKAILDRDFHIELERLEKKMVLAKVEFETEQLRKELAEREAQSAKLRRHFGAGDDPYDYHASPSSGKYSSMSSAGYDNYGSMDQGYSSGYGASYDAHYGEAYKGYQAGASGYGKSREEALVEGGIEGLAARAAAAAAAGGGYEGSYGSAGGDAGIYDRADYGPSVGAYDDKYDRGSYDTGAAPLVQGGKATQPRMPNPTSDHSFRKLPAPEPPAIKEPYQMSLSKRPRY